MNKSLRAEIINTLEKLLNKLKAGPSDSLLDIFLTEHAHHAKGAVMPFKEFCDKFEAWADQHGLHGWTKRRVKAEMPARFPVGICAGNARCIGNLAWAPGDHAAEPIKLRRNGRLSLSVQTRR